MTKAATSRRYDVLLITGYLAACAALFYWMMT